MIVANTKLVTNDDMHSLSGIPSWLTDYVKINDDGDLEAKVAGSPFELEPYKILFYLDVDAEKVYAVEMPDGSPVECQTV